jgi:hypothetical protein
MIVGAFQDPAGDEQRRCERDRWMCAFRTVDHRCRDPEEELQVHGAERQMIAADDDAQRPCAQSEGQ